MSNYLSRDKQTYLAEGLMRGKPQRFLSEQLGVDRKTVARHGRWLGKTALYLLDQQTNLNLGCYQFDEFYTYVLAKRYNTPKVKSPVVLFGEYLHFLSIGEDSGFIVNHLVAPSNAVGPTSVFLKDFDSRLARDGDGKYLTTPQVITDGHGSYWSVIEHQYKSWNYARYIKESTNTTKDGREVKKRVFGGVRREIMQGTIRNPDTFTTDVVEGVNSSARALNMRVHKKSKAFSKRFAQHREQFGLWAWFYNYAGLQERRKQTPAMAAGVDSRLWTSKQLIIAAEEFRERVGDQGVFEDEGSLGFDLPTFDVADASTYWLYRSFAQHTSKVHRPKCRFCNYGAGADGESKYGLWLPFRTIEEALAYGEGMAPGSASLCRECIDERNFWRGR